MLIFVLLFVPLIGALWFYNFAIFLEKLKNGKNAHNQKVLGVALTFIFLAVFMYSMGMLSSY